MHTGLFVVIEGIDCCGKTSICKILSTRLTEQIGSPPHIMEFPDRTTPIGSIINDHLKKTNIYSPRVAHLLFSANRWEKEKEINEKRKKNIVIAGRYYYSGIAYSQTLELDPEWTKWPDKGLPKPDLVFFIDAKPEIVEKREGFGDEIYEQSNFQAKVYKIMKNLMDTHKAITIDGTLDLEDIVDRIAEKILEKLKV